MSRPRNLEAAPSWQAERAFVRKLVAAARVRACDIEDVAHDVLVAAVTSTDRFLVPEGSSPTQARQAWLRAITARCVANYLRKRVRRQAQDLVAEVPSGNWLGAGSAPSAEDLTLSGTAQSHLREGLSRLQDKSPSAWAVVVAYELDDLPMERVAALLGICKNTAWNQLRLGRAALRGHIQRVEAQERGGVYLAARPKKKRAK